MDIIIMEGGNQLNLQSVIQITSPWKQKTDSTYIFKIIKLQSDSSALIIRQDCNKPLRFLYLALLMSKKSSHNMNILMSKIGQIKTVRSKMNFTNMSSQMLRLVGSSLQIMHDQLIELHKKLEAHNFTYITILKLSHQFALVDPLLILSLRTIAEDYKMTQALDCSSTLPLGQIQVLMNKFFVDKGAVVNTRNKYVIFWSLTQIQYEFFRKRGVIIAKQSDCFDELSDSQTIKYEEYLMIQKFYSLL